jgi:hypothetical protein
VRLALLFCARIARWKSITALGAHTFANGRLASLHNEEKSWEFEYNYGTAVRPTPPLAKVISTTDGGYAFCVGVVDPPSAAGIAQVIDGPFEQGRRC